MSSGKPEAFKNDFPNALKRNLHNWAQWRVDVNDQLVTSLMTGTRNVEVEPLGKYLHNSKHPTENPSTLLAYSASTGNISSLGMRRFLHYGIPRAKVNHGRRQSELSSQPPSTYTIHEHPEEFPHDSEYNTMNHEPYFDPPYHPPEPHPDYEDKYLDSKNCNFSDIDPDDITAPGSSSSSTDSSDTETIYVAESPLPTTSHKASTHVTSTESRRPISRTYSTLNALDPIYMTQTSKNTMHSRITKNKQATLPPRETPLESLLSPAAQAVPAHVPHYPAVPAHVPHYPAVPAHAPHYPAVPAHAPHYPAVPAHAPHYPAVPAHAPHYPTVPTHAPHHRARPRGEYLFQRHSSHDPHDYEMYEVSHPRASHLGYRTMHY